MGNYMGHCNLTLNYTVSITLKARWFKASTGSKVGLLERCDNVTKTVDVDPYSVCSGPVSGRYQYDKNYMSALFTNSTHALTFETEQSIKAKLCALKSKFLKLNFGISVYDIDADMEDKSCATVQYRGRYERLKLLKRILDFLKGYTAANMKKECENL
ncbi:uncharacterized protein LOC142784945 [Rhipicephalus microplus]|uniref:uncharacterized protein LOC142784945 n=1 Tax=Rhipicephalus microplus TaxID=6941 RepID=UPI003F6D0C98